MPAFTRTATALLCLQLPFAFAYEDGAPPGFTGGFGEDDCSACHADNPRNHPPGRLLLSGLPDDVRPGQEYPLVITLAHAELASAGLQLSVRFEDGSNAGELTSDDPSLVIVSDNGIAFLQQLRSAEATALHEVSWRFFWRAPALPGTVQLNVAANASNGDRSALGDFIYTLRQTSTCDSITD